MKRGASRAKNQYFFKYFSMVWSSILDNVGAKCREGSRGESELLTIIVGNRENAKGKWKKCGREI